MQARPLTASAGPAAAKARSKGNESMYSQLTVELMRARQHEIALAAERSRHRREFDSQRTGESAAPRRHARQPRFAFVQRLIGGATPAR